VSSVDSTALPPSVLPVPKSHTTAVLGQSSTFQTFIFNTLILALVCAAGVLGWYISLHSSSESSLSEQKPRDTLILNPWGQVFGYLCAALFLFSRIPQLLLNWRRKSTKGISLLFFLFTCVGNLTYAMSIFAYLPVCEAQEDTECQPRKLVQIYLWYILINASWLLGSLGTLILDLSIFAQFILYRERNKDAEEKRDEEETWNALAVDA
jgi:uncharacterized protein with PQ loop repeat